MGGMGVPFRARTVCRFPLSSLEFLRPGYVVDGSVVLAAGDSVLLVAQTDKRRLPGRVGWVYVCVSVNRRVLAFPMACGRFRRMEPNLCGARIP